MAGWKTVRVFISSTFSDMHSERDHLVKRVFPELRERLLPYRIHLVDIDLRWGITEDEAKSDRALALCLQQIDECRPFFVGILGERYGWVPETFDEQAVEKYGWIQHATGKSITELEILYGVLRKDDMRTNSFFYFRDPAFIRDVPAAHRAAVINEDVGADEKLRDLKDAIRAAKLPVPPLENYPCAYAGLRVNWWLVSQQLDPERRAALETIADDGVVDAREYASLTDELRTEVNKVSTVLLERLETFGERVLDNLWHAMKAEYGLPDTPPIFKDDPLAEEQDFHERFMESRTRVYIGREVYQRQLANVASADTPYPCIVTGPGGMGKSALMAKFATTHAEQHPEVLVVPHFVGASPRSTSLREMLDRFCRVLKQHFGYEEELKLDTRELATQFREFIARAGAQHADSRVVFVIDALNQIDETDNAHALQWLPRELPSNVKVIASCIDEKDRQEPVIQALKGRKAYRIRLEPLTDAERRDIVTKVPSLSAKTLAMQQVQLLLENPATENPLFLLIALEELRGFGSFDLLNARIAALPQGEGAVIALFAQVFERLELEFEASTVKDILSLLASARRGLSEKELQEILSTDSNQKLELFEILRQLRPYLQSRGGLLDFFHRALLEATQLRYLETSEAQRKAHDRLADYFRRQADPAGDTRWQGRTSPRGLEELPYHLSKSQRRQDLAAVLCDLGFIEAKCSVGMTYSLLADYSETETSLLPEVNLHKQVQYFRDFVLSESHILCKFPSLTAQQAYNNPFGSAVAIAAEAFWKAGRFPSGLLVRFDKHRPQTRCSLTLRAHDGEITAACWSPDGTQLLSASRDGTLRLWNSATGSIIHELAAFDTGVLSAAWAKDKPRLHVVLANGDIFRIDIRTGNTLHVLKTRAGQPSSAAWSPDLSRVALAYHDGQFRVLDATTGDALWELRNDATFPVGSHAWSPDGDLIATYANRGEITLWKSADGRKSGAMPLDLGTTIPPRFAPDNRRMCWSTPRITGSATITVADLGINRVIDEVATGLKELVTASWASDGKRIAAGARDGTTAVTSATSYAGPHLLGYHNGKVVSVAIALGAPMAATGAADGTLGVWDLQRRRQVWTTRAHQDPVHAVQLSFDGTQVLSCDVRGQVRLWDVLSEKCLINMEVGAPLRGGIGFDDELGRVVLAVENGGATLWDLKTKRPVTVLDQLTNRVVTPVAMGMFVLGGNADGSLFGWESSTGECVCEARLTPYYHCGETRLTSLAQSECLEEIAAGCADGGVYVVHTREGETGYCGHHDKEVVWVRFAAGGKQVLSLGSEGRLHVWTAESRLYNQPLLTLTQELLTITSGDCTEDASLILTGASCGRVQLWAADAGPAPILLRGHEHSVRELSWSPDNRLLASGDTAGTVRIWEVPTSGQVEARPEETDRDVREAWEKTSGHAIGTIEERYRRPGEFRDCKLMERGRVAEVISAGGSCLLHGHTAPILSCERSPDCRHYATVSEDCTARVWDARTGSCLATLRGHRLAVTACAWRGDGTTLLTASYDGTLRLWSVPKGESIAILEGHGRAIRACAWGNEGKWFASLGIDRTMRVWDAEGYTQLAIFADVHDGYSLATAEPDWILIGDFAGRTSAYLQFCPYLGATTLRSEGYGVST